LGWDGAVAKFTRVTEGFADDRLQSDIVDTVDRLEAIEIKELTELLGQVRRSA
jgi:hypothetical protein